MSANSSDIANYLIDRTLAALERARLSPPDEPEDEREQFDGLSEDDQRSTIREWIRKSPCQDGLLGEAINESSYASQIRAAYFANDLEQYQRLCDRATREYIGGLIQKEWDRAHG